MDMILTGRPVDAQEAFSIGLANRIIPQGQALEEALNMARELLKFPQKCMQADLVSVHYSAYDAASLEDTLRFEFERGALVIAEESVQGTKMFNRALVGVANLASASFRRVGTISLGHYRSLILRLFKVRFAALAVIRWPVKLVNY